MCRAVVHGTKDTSSNRTAGSLMSDISNAASCVSDEWDRPSRHASCGGVERSMRRACAELHEKLRHMEKVSLGRAGSQDARW